METFRLGLLFEFQQYTEKFQDNNLEYLWHAGHWNQQFEIVDEPRTRDFFLPWVGIDRERESQKKCWQEQTKNNSNFLLFWINYVNNFNNSSLGNSVSACCATACLTLKH